MTITAPDGTVVAPPPVADVAIHHVTAAHVRVGTATGGLLLGGADRQIHAAGYTKADRLAEMARIGREITAQAERLLGDLPAPEPACETSEVAV